MIEGILVSLVIIYCVRNYALAQRKKIAIENGTHTEVAKTLKSKTAIAWPKWALTGFVVAVAVACVAVVGSEMVFLLWLAGSH